MYLLPLLVLPGCAQTVSVPLTVTAGTPLRLYLTQRLSMHVGATAHARLIEPVYAFDRVVIPKGSELEGRVTKLDGASRLVRTQAILAGDFTPLHRARVEFREIRFPNGRELQIHTISSEGLATLYEPPSPKQKPPKKTKSPAPAKPGWRELAKQQAQQQMNTRINGQLDARTYGLGSLVRGPNKKERLEDFLLHKLPYHPQWYRRGTRFDAVLDQPLNFGTAALKMPTLRELGSSQNLDREAQVRFLTTVSSASAKVGDPVEAELVQPLIGDSNLLVLPEGTLLHGRVRRVKRARWLHRAGQLRFSFDRMDLPAVAESIVQRPLVQSEARLESAESDPGANIKIDSEGSARATEPKKRLLGPAVSALVAVKSMDNDAGKQMAAGGGNGNGAGLALGGFSGFGLLGIAAGRASSIAGSALGMYGLAWSVFNAILSRGSEVEFDRNSWMAVRFGSRPLPDPAKH